MGYSELDVISKQCNTHYIPRYLYQATDDRHTYLAILIVDIIKVGRYICRKEYLVFGY